MKTVVIESSTLLVAAKLLDAYAATLDSNRVSVMAEHIAAELAFEVSRQCAGPDTSADELIEQAKRLEAQFDG